MRILTNYGNYPTGNLIIIVNSLVTYDEVESTLSYLSDSHSCFHPPFDNMNIMSSTISP
jgi:hypothetical protein